MLEIESPTRLYESPSTHFVADFIGTMNFFPGTVSRLDRGQVTVACDSLGEVRVDPNRVDVADGAAVVVGIRPEKLRLELSRPQDADHAVEGRMGPSAYLGDRSHCHVYLAGREEPVAVALQNQHRTPSAVAADQPVWLTWASDSVVLLRPD